MSTINLNVAVVASDPKVRTFLFNNSDSFKNIHFTYIENHNLYHNKELEKFDMVMYHFEQGQLGCFRFINRLRDIRKETPIIVLGEELPCDMARTLFYCGVEEVIQCSDDCLAKIKGCFSYYSRENSVKLLWRHVYQDVKVAVKETFPFKKIQELAFTIKSILF